MHKAGAIKKAADEYSQAVSSFVLVPARVPGSHIRRFHRQMIAKSIEALEFKTPLENAFKTTVLSIQASTELPTCVYALTNQLFKLAEMLKILLRNAFVQSSGQV